MDLLIAPHQLRFLIEQAAAMGAELALTRAGKLKPYLKKSEAFRLYGRANIENWVEEGLIAPRKDGDHSACWRIERFEVEAIVKAKFLLQRL